MGQGGWPPTHASAPGPPPSDATVKPTEPKPPGADICLGLTAAREEFRTEPLMGLRHATRFLHDGRATSLEAAIQAHKGEAAAARDAFQALSEGDRQALLEFLLSL